MEQLQDSCAQTIELLTSVSTSAKCHNPPAESVSKGSDSQIKLFLVSLLSKIISGQHCFSFSKWFLVIIIVKILLHRCTVYSRRKQVLHNHSSITQSFITYHRHPPTLHAPRTPLQPSFLPCIHRYQFTQPHKPRKDQWRIGVAGIRQFSASLAAVSRALGRGT